MLLMAKPTRLNLRISEAFRADIETLAAFRDASKIEIQAGGTEFAIHDVALTIFKDMFKIVS